MSINSTSALVCIAFATLVLAGCTPDQPPAQAHDNDWIISRLNARMGGNPDATTGTPRELHYLVRRQFGGEEVICGWTGFPTRVVNGVPSPPNEAIFIFRNDHLYIAQDMSPEQFVQWQDRYCGEKWVKPLPSFGAVN